VHVHVHGMREHGVVLRQGVTGDSLPPRLHSDAVVVPGVQCENRVEVMLGLEQLQAKGVHTFSWRLQRRADGHTATTLLVGGRGRDKDRDRKEGLDGGPVPNQATLRRPHLRMGPSVDGVERYGEGGWLERYDRQRGAKVTSHTRHFLSKRHGRTADTLSDPHPISAPLGRLAMRALPVCGDRVGSVVRSAASRLATDAGLYAVLGCLSFVVDVAERGVSAVCVAGQESRHVMSAARRFRTRVRVGRAGHGERICLNITRDTVNRAAPLCRAFRQSATERAGAPGTLSNHT
jgi:hypothetical protein